MSTEVPQPVAPGAPPPEPAKPPERITEQSPLPKDAAHSRPARRVDRRVWLIAVPALVVGAVWFAIGHRTKMSETPQTPVAAQVVAVARVTREDLYNQITVPAEFRPYEEVELHAKVSGYVKELNVDFGDRVKAGQLLATLEVPELKAELDQAVAAEKKAEADYRDAHLSFTRLQAVDKQNPNLVAQQELDSAEAKDSTAEAAIAGAKAAVERYQTLFAYTRITAPFDGVITRRYVDPGTLIQAGTASETQSLPVVRISDNYRLRLDFSVSVDDVKDIHVGDTVDVLVQSLGHKGFKGIITRSTERVTEDTRTMISEIEVPNPTLLLVPGMYATVMLKVQARPQALAIPAETISTDKKSTVYLISQDHEIEERPVTLGLEMPGKYEVLAGLNEGDLVMIGDRSQVKPGQKVQPMLLGSLAQQ